MNIVADLLRLDDLPPVSLEDLLAQAALLSRVDHKYLLERSSATQVLAELAPVSQVLEIDGRRSFDYQTAYFDLPQLDTFYATARRRRKRFKVRVRVYRDSGLAWLEVKSRTGGRLTIKDRLPVDRRLIDAFHLPGYALRYVEEILAMRMGPFFEIPDLAALQSVMMTGYQRSTLLLPEAGERITVDQSLAVWRRGESGLQLSEQVIMETKSRSGRSAVDHLLWDSAVRPRSISKYATGMALLDPTLPRNRWTRTISQMRVEALEHDTGDFREEN